MPNAAGGTLTLTGPDAPSFAEVARLIGEAAGKAVSYQPGEGAAFHARLLAAGHPAWYADAMLGLYDDFRAGLNAPVSPDIATVLGRPPRSVAAFAGEFAARWMNS